MTHYAEIYECRRLAIEHDDEPCILHGGDGQWCWNLGLDVNTIMLMTTEFEGEE